MQPKFIAKLDATTRITTALVLTGVLLSGCTTPEPPPPVRIPPPTIGEVSLRQTDAALEAHQLLDIGVMIFENTPHEFALLQNSQVDDAVFDELRQNEMQYLPYVLRNSLLESNQWGAIRVLPETDPSVDLVISGAIVESDGLRLELKIRAVDSTGRIWLDKTYADMSTAEEYPDSTRYTARNRFDAANFKDPFHDLYNKINNDLVAKRDALNTEQLINLRRVSEMVYASDLSPETFSHNLERETDGLLTVSSLPSSEDPMMRRVAEMRLRHYAFIDRVDQYYKALFDEMQPVYVTWRHYSRDQTLEDQFAERQIYQGDQYGNSGRFLTLSQRYDRYRWAKIYEFEFAELASGFNNEIAPAILQLNENVHGLEGTMSDQYSQWRKILRSLFALELEQAQSVN